METAIIVDWELYCTNPYTQDFVAARAGQTRLVLLVPNPDLNDYDPTEPVESRTVPSRPITEPHQEPLEFDVVIRNTGGKTTQEFKQHAMDIIRDVSTMLPVITLDGDLAMNKIYREVYGVLITTGDI